MENSSKLLECSISLNSFKERSQQTTDIWLLQQRDTGKTCQTISHRWAAELNFLWVEHVEKGAWFEKVEEFFSLQLLMVWEASEIQKLLAGKKGRVLGSFYAQLRWDLLPGISQGAI